MDGSLAPWIVLAVTPDEARMMDWNPRSPISWAKMLGLAHLPMFGHTRARRHAGDYTVLLDGDRASMVFALGGVDRLLTQTDQLDSWSWSSNLTHTLIVDEDRDRLLVRRWDNPDSIQEFPLPTPQQASQLLEGLAESDLPSTTVIDRMKEVFRIIRSNIDELGGSQTDVVHAFNALLVGTDAVRRGIISAEQWAAAASLGDALLLIEKKQLATFGPSSVSARSHHFPVRQLVEALLERDRDTSCYLDPDLLIRHAAGELYQEAQIELMVKPFRQGYLFPSVALNVPAPKGDPRSDAHYTPLPLARALVEEAVAALVAMRGILTRIEALDPACGSGVFLIEALREIAFSWGQGLTLRGVDTSPVACAMTDFCLRRAVQDGATDQMQVVVDVQKHDSLASDYSWGEPDLILMNPPFTAWGAMSQDEERAQIKEVLGSLYFGHPDKAVAFVWKAIQSLKPGAVLATIVPAPFLGSESGRPLRSAIESDPSLGIQLLGRFHGFGYFERATVEPAFLVISRALGASPQRHPAKIVIANRGSEDKAIRELRKASAGSSWSADPQGNWQVSGTDPKGFPAENWAPQWKHSEELIKALSRTGVPCVADLFHVRLGVRTGANDVFVLSRSQLEALGASNTERSLFRPVAGNATIHEGVLAPTEYVFYPYADDGRPIFETEQELQRAAPEFFRRSLLPNKSSLERRKSVRARHWWELVEPRSTWQPKFEPKIVSTCFGDRGSFAYDQTGACCVIQGFAWLWKKPGFAGTDLPWAYLALLNSPAFEMFVGHFCPRVRGGQYDLYPKYVNNVFIPDLSDPSRVNGQMLAGLARMGRSIAQGVLPDLRSLDLTVAHAYGLPLDVMRTGGPKTGQAAAVGGNGTLEKQFQELVRTWKAERGLTSSVAKMAAHPAYRQIIALGETAVPLLLAELASHPDHWFLALHEITGADPVPKESQGRLREMAAAWLKWGKEHGFIR